MKLKLSQYLDSHPIQKAIVRHWLKYSLYIPEKIKRQIINQIHAEIINRILIEAVNNKNINFDRIKNILFDFGKEIAHDTQDILPINPNNAKSLSGIVSFINNLLDIKGKEVISSNKCVVRHENYCFLSEQFNEQKAPYYCIIFQEIYKGLLSELNPKATANNLEITQSNGSEYCEIITKIES